MASTSTQVSEALRKAAESLLGRTLTQKEHGELIDRFNRTEGTFRQRADDALRRFTGLTESEFRTKQAASDNTDRIINDLHKILDDWKP